MDRRDLTETEATEIVIDTVIETAIVTETVQCANGVVHLGIHREGHLAASKGNMKVETIAIQSVIGIKLKIIVTNNEFIYISQFSALLLSYDGKIR